MSELRSDAKMGITSASIADREAAYGHNRKAKQVLKTLYALFVESMDDFTLKILIVAAFISIGIGSK